MPEFDLLIKNGLVFDGLRNPRRNADIGVRDGVIAEIGTLRASSAARVIDASGLHVAPGFIDIHTHYDSQVFWDPHCSISSWHGVTSVAVGNCGFGFAPVRREARERAMKSMERAEAIPVECMKAGMPWDWETFPEFLDSLERTPKAVNIVPYLPLNPVLVWVMGAERAKAGELPSDAEHAELERLLGEAMDAGACGFSARRNEGSKGDFDGTPFPTDIMHPETVLRLAEVLAGRNRGVIQYLYADAHFNMGPKARRHVEDLAAVGRPVIWNAVATDPGQPGLHREVLAWLKSCRERGLPLYPQGVTTMPGMTFSFGNSAGIPGSDAALPWKQATMGETDERLAKLRDPAHRAKMKAERPSRFVFGEVGNTVVARGRTPETQRFDGMKIRDVALTLDRDDVDAMAMLAVADNLETDFYIQTLNNDQALLKELIAEDFVLAGSSDGGAHTKWVTVGSYPTLFLTMFARDLGWLSLEEAHWRLSTYPARCMGLRNRGSLQPGAAADIVVYDYAKLGMQPEEIARDYPRGEWRRVQRAKGFRHVLVNGEAIIEDDREVTCSPGRLLRLGKQA